MLKLFESLRSKLLFSFGLFVLLLLIVVLANIWQMSVRKRIDKITAFLNDSERHLQEASRYQYIFLSDETINPKFYITGHSDVLDKQRLSLSSLSQSLQQLKKAEDGLLQYTGGNQLIDSALTLVKTDGLLFDSLSLFVKERGFKDWGVVGQMRQAIHKVEYYGDVLDMQTVLMIRRHEKDFIIRKDLAYQQKLAGKIQTLAAQIRSKKGIEEEGRLRILRYIHAYDSLFERLVYYEKKIGFDTREEGGLRYQINTVATNLREYLTVIHEQIIGEAVILRKRIYWGTGIVMVLSLILGVIIAFFISTTLGAPFEKLSESIHQAVSSGFAPEIHVQPLRSQDEIGRLSKDVSYMLTQVHSSMKTIKDSSDKIAEKQQQLLNSLHYAEQIQQAILPDKEDFDSYLPKHFLIYRPQHVVSGDFYWLVKRKGVLFLAVVDCTGHGIPGAFMSMIGHTLLNKIVVQSKILDPSTILESLHHEVVDALKQHQSNKGSQGKINEGMDISLCAITHEHDGWKVAFAGANQPLFYAKSPNKQNNPVVKLKGVSRSIGESHKQSRPFVNHDLYLPEGSFLYLCSDGYADQNNMEQKKIGSKKLEELLATASAMPLEEQRNFLEEYLDRHQGNQSQRDDITVLGVQL